MRTMVGEPHRLFSCNGWGSLRTTRFTPSGFAPALQFCLLICEDRAIFAAFSGYSNRPRQTLPVRLAVR